MTPRAERSNALDGVRALAALSVLLFHVWLYRDNRPSAPRTELLDNLFFQANIGLICFFVLSGYLLYRGFARASVSGGPRPSISGYAQRRVARIVPAYYACVAGSIVMYAVLGPANLTPDADELPLFLVFGQNYSTTTLMQINPVTWTLCVEAAFYVALPIIALCALRFGPRRVGAHAALLVALIGVTVLWNTLDVRRGWGEIPGKTLLAYTGHFAAGMLVALWLEWRRVTHGRDVRFGAGVTAALVLTGAAVVAGNSYWAETYRQFGPEVRVVGGTLFAAAGFALIVAGVAGGRGPSVNWLRARPLVAVGLISYGVYLWHLPLLLAARSAGILPHDLLPRIGVVLGLTLVVAAASWHLLERPIIERVGRKRSASRPAPAWPASSPAEPAVLQG